MLRPPMHLILFCTLITHPESKSTFMYVSSVGQVVILNKVIHDFQLMSPCVYAVNCICHTRIIGLVQFIIYHMSGITQKAHWVKNHLESVLYQNIFISITLIL